MIVFRSQITCFALLFLLIFAAGSAVTPGSAAALGTAAADKYSAPGSPLKPASSTASLNNGASQFRADFEPAAGPPGGGMLARRGATGIAPEAQGASSQTLEPRDVSAYRRIVTDNSGRKLVIPPQVGKADAIRLFFTGLWHALLVKDHLVFITILLLQAAFGRGGGFFDSSVPFEEVFSEIFYMVLGFVAASAWASYLALNGTITIPPPHAEAAALGLVTFLALNNLAPMMPSYPILAVVLYGVAHGAGFRIFEDGPELEQLPFALLSFHAGIMVAQLAVSAVLIPFLTRIKFSSLAYRDAMLKALSCVFAVSLWLLP